MPAFLFSLTTRGTESANGSHVPPAGKEGCDPVSHPRDLRAARHLDLSPHLFPRAERLPVEHADAPVRPEVRRPGKLRARLPGPRVHGVPFPHGPLRPDRRSHGVPSRAGNCISRHLADPRPPRLPCGPPDAPHDDPRGGRRPVAIPPRTRNTVLWISSSRPSAVTR